MRRSPALLGLMLLGLSIHCRADGRLALAAGLVSSTANTGMPKELKPAWNIELDAPDSKDLGSFEHVDWSSTGSCIAVETPSGFTVFQPDGTKLWKHPFSAPFFGKKFRTMAVADSGETVVLAGDSDDKEILFFSKSSDKVTSVHCRGTAWAMHFSLDGKLLAATTGAGLAYLINETGRVLWSGATDKLILAWPGKPGGLRKNAKPKSLWAKEDIRLLKEAEASPIDGTRYSDDAKCAVSWGIPNHGTDIGWLYFDKTGSNEHVWQKYTYDTADALINGVGSQVLVASDQVSDDLKVLKDNPPNSPTDMIFYVFDQTGHLLKTWPSPGQGRFLGYSNNEQSFFYEYWGGPSVSQQCVVEEDLNANIEWFIHSDSIMRPGQYFLGPDRKWILNYQKNHLSGYEIGI